MRNRPIVRHVHVSGLAFGVPAIVIVGAPYVIDVPGLGWVYVPEVEYPALFAMLTSEDPAQVEAGYALLHQYAIRKTPISISHYYHTTSKFRIALLCCA